MPKYDEISVGDSDEIRHILTTKDIDKFVDLSGDDNRLHVDADYAAKTSFKRPVAHGMLGASFISAVIGTRLPGDGALWFSQSLEFLLPVRVGDELIIRAEVIKKIDHLHAIELLTEIHNQFGQKVTSGIAKVKIIEQEETAQQDQLIKSKVALIIGGSGGIGGSICLELAKDGFDVAVHYFNNLALAQKISEEVKVFGRKSITVSANIQNEAEVEVMLRDVGRKLGPIAVLVNCATSKIVTLPLARLGWDNFESQLGVAIKGAFILAKMIAPIMEKQGYGKIIHIGSQAIETPSIDWLPYITAKSALTGFSRALAMELAPKGVTVNIISPGMTDTDLIADIPERVRLMTAGKTPMRRLAKPKDIANVVSFLSSEKSDFLTGETIRVNGGQVML